MSGKRCALPRFNYLCRNVQLAESDLGCTYEPERIIIEPMKNSKNSHAVAAEYRRLAQLSVVKEIFQDKLPEYHIYDFFGNRLFLRLVIHYVTECKINEPIYLHLLYQYNQAKDSIRYDFKRGQHMEDWIGIRNVPKNIYMYRREVDQQVPLDEILDGMNTVTHVVFNNVYNILTSTGGILQESVLNRKWLMYIRNRLDCNVAYTGHLFDINREIFAHADMLGVKIDRTGDFARYVFFPSFNASIYYDHFVVDASTFFPCHKFVEGPVSAIFYKRDVLFSGRTYNSFLYNVDLIDDFLTMNIVLRNMPVRNFLVTSLNYERIRNAAMRDAVYKNRLFLAHTKAGAVYLKYFEKCIQIMVDREMQYACDELEHKKMQVLPFGFHDLNAVQLSPVAAVLGVIKKHFDIIGATLTSIGALATAGLFLFKFGPSSAAIIADFAALFTDDLKILIPLTGISPIFEDLIREFIPSMGWISPVCMHAIICALYCILEIVLNLGNPVRIPCKILLQMLLSLNSYLTNGEFSYIRGLIHVIVDISSLTPIGTILSLVAMSVLICWNAYLVLCDKTGLKPMSLVTPDEPINLNVEPPPSIDVELTIAPSVALETKVVDTLLKLDSLLINKSGDSNDKDSLDSKKRELLGIQYLAGTLDPMQNQIEADNEEPIHYTVLFKYSHCIPLDMDSGPYTAFLSVAYRSLMLTCHENLILSAKSKDELHNIMISYGRCRDGIMETSERLRIAFRSWMYSTGVRFTLKEVKEHIKSKNYDKAKTGLYLNKLYNLMDTFNLDEETYVDDLWTRDDVQKFVSDRCTTEMIPKQNENVLKHHFIDEEWKKGKAIGCNRSIANVHKVPVILTEIYIDHVKHRICEFQDEGKCLSFKITEHQTAYILYAAGVTTTRLEKWVDGIVNCYKDHEVVVAQAGGDDNNTQFWNFNGSLEDSYKGGISMDVSKYDSSQNLDFLKEEWKILDALFPNISCMFFASSSAMKKIFMPRDGCSFIFKRHMRLSGHSDTSFGNTIVMMILLLHMMRVKGRRVRPKTMWDNALALKDAGFTFTICQNEYHHKVLERNTFLRCLYTIHDGHIKMVPVFGLYLKAMNKMRNADKYDLINKNRTYRGWYIYAHIYGMIKSFTPFNIVQSLHYAFSTYVAEPLVDLSQDKEIWSMNVHAYGEMAGNYGIIVSDECYAKRYGIHVENVSYVANTMTLGSTMNYTNAECEIIDAMYAYDFGVEQSTSLSI